MLMQTPRSGVLGQPMKLFISTPVKRLGFKFLHALTLLSQDEVRGHSWAPPGPNYAPLPVPYNKLKRSASGGRQSQKGIKCLFAYNMTKSWNDSDFSIF